MPQAAPRFGQPRPIDRLGRAGRPYRPWFRHGVSPLVPRAALLDLGRPEHPDELGLLQGVAAAAARAANRVLEDKVYDCRAQGEGEGAWCRGQPQALLDAVADGLLRLARRPLVLLGLLLRGRRLPLRRMAYVLRLQPALPLPQMRQLAPLQRLLQAVAAVLLGSSSGAAAGAPRSVSFGGRAGDPAPRSAPGCGGCSSSRSSIAACR
eukprot:scaffold91909_cov75-Phaeocystis_antarctica.AAC.5